MHSIIHILLIVTLSLLSLEYVSAGSYTIYGDTGCSGPQYATSWSLNECSTITHNNVNLANFKVRLHTMTSYKNIQVLWKTQRPIFFLSSVLNSTSIFISY
jgi:hypothetical protein